MRIKKLIAGLLCLSFPLLVWSDEVCSYNFANVLGGSVMDSGPSQANLKMEGFAENAAVADAPGGKCAVFNGGETISGPLPLKPGDYEDLQVSFKFKSSGLDDKRQMVLELGAYDGLKFYFHYNAAQKMQYFCVASVYSDMDNLPEIKANGTWVSCTMPIEGAKGPVFQGEWRDIKAYRDPKDKKLKLFIDGKLVFAKPCPYPVSLTNAPRNKPNWESAPLKISMGGKNWPLKGAIADIKVSLGGSSAPVASAPDSKDKIADGVFRKVESFYNSLLWDLKVLSGMDFPMSFGQPGFSYMSRLQAVSSKIAALKKDKDVTAAGAVYAELEKIERDMILDSIQVIQPPYSAPSRILSPSAVAENELKKKLAFFSRENEEMMKDWEKDAAALKSFGVDSGIPVELERLTALKPESSAAPINRFYEQAASFYRRMAQDRYSLGAGIIAAGNELDSLVKTAALRVRLGSQKLDINAAENKAKQLVSEWKNAYNSGNYTAASDRKRDVDAVIRSLRTIVFAPSSAAPVIRPGAGFFSSGNFAEGGDWQALPNSAARGAGFFIDASDRGSFMPCTDDKINWSVSFDPPNSTLDKYEIKDTSWTHSHRLYTFKNPLTGKAVKQDCWWSSLAPGVLFDACGPDIAFADTTMGNPVPPAKIIAVINGKVSVIKKGEAIDPSRMTEGWILLVWENGMPQIPILILFEKRPAKIIWSDNGLTASGTPELGKFAAAMLYGAQPQAADWSKNADVDKVSEQCRKVASHLAFFPLELEEFYSIGTDKVTIYDRVSKYIEFKSDWNTPVKPYITVPYLYALGLDCGAPVEFDKQLSDSLNLTLFGPFRAAEGLELSYTVPRISMDQREPLKPSGEESFIAEYNKHFQARAGERWRFFYESLQFASGWCMMDEKSRDFFECYKNPRELEGAINGEMPMKPWAVHTTQAYDLNLVIDSASGKSCWMRGWRGFRNSVRLIGDHTCFNMLSLAGAYTYAKYFGRWDLIEKYWPLMLNFYSSTPYRQLWAVPGQDCLSAGLIFSGDMLGDGQRANSLAATMAKVIGDKDTEALAVYIGSRTAVSAGVLMHPNIIVYNAALKNSPAPSSPDAVVEQLGVQNSGFATRPFKPYTATTWNAPLNSAGCTIYDYPFYAFMLDYYPRTSLNWINRYLKDMPEWRDWSYRKDVLVRILNAWQILKFKAYTGKDRDALRKLFYDYFAPKNDKDWNFYSWLSYGNVVPHIIAQNDPIWLGEWDRAVIKSGEYDRNKRTAAICLRAAVAGELSITSLLAPSSVTVNGSELASSQYSYNSTRHELKVPFSTGEHRVTVTLPEYDASRINYPDFAAQNTGSPLNLAKCPPPAKLNVEVLTGDLKTDKCDAIDIRAVCNMGFDDKTANDKTGGTDDNGDSWLFPKGNTIIRGVPFEIIDPDKNGGKSCIVLKGSAKNYFPEKTALIPVGKVFKRIFFLHGCGYGGGRGIPVLTYKLNFEGGQKRIITAREAFNIDEWKVKPGGKALPDLPDARGGAYYPPGRKGQWGEGAGGYVFEWKNDVKEAGVTNQDADQRGLAKLESIEISSPGNAVPMVFAITGEQ